MDQAPNRPRRVAIACQGGGSHTAFTAGVLKGLVGADVLSRHQIVGLSGTSGGAVCALLTWYALIDDDPTAAGRLLDGFWSDNAATTPADQLANAWLLWVSRLQNYVVTPAVSPYDTITSVTGIRHLRSLLERRVDFDRIHVTDDPTQPMLLLGAVDVRSGDFKAFNSRRDRISPEMVLASAAIPTLFRAVHLDGRPYWDGLFSQNPPVRELLDAHPDEIWVIQVNARHRPDEPRTVVDIADRRNELSGNLSLHQELHFIEKINQLLDDGLLTADDRYGNVTVRVIELTRSRLSRAMGTTSKLNRDPGFIGELVDHGVARRGVPGRARLRGRVAAARCRQRPRQAHRGRRAGGRRGPGMTAIGRRSSAGRRRRSSTARSRRSASAPMPPSGTRRAPWVRSSLGPGRRALRQRCAGAAGHRRNRRLRAGSPDRFLYQPWTAALGSW